MLELRVSISIEQQSVGARFSSSQWEQDSAAVSFNDSCQLLFKLRILQILELVIFWASLFKGLFY